MDTVQAQTYPLELNIFLPNAASSTTLLPEYEQSIGNTRFYAVKWYQDWSEPFNPESAKRINSMGKMPELTWQPQINGYFSYNEVTSGKFDTYLKTMADSIKSLPFTIRISLAPEMNTDWVPWSVMTNGNTNESHKAFWRYVVTTFRNQGTTNVEWIWSPNIITWNQKYSYADTYPGNEYVNYVGLDGYNWGASTSWGTWQSFRQVFEVSYNNLITVTDKKVLIMEMGSTELGGNKAQWIHDMFQDIPVYFPRLQGITWFNINKETDWRIESTVSSKEAFIENAKLVSWSPVISQPSPTPTVAPKFPIDGERRNKILEFIRSIYIRG